jgi:hypothetical protein
MANNAAFQAQGQLNHVSVTGSASTPFQMATPGSNSPANNAQAYAITNTSTTLYVVAVLSAASQNAAIPAAGTPGTPASNSHLVPPNTRIVVLGPPNAFVSFIGSGAGPTDVFIVAGEGMS